MLPEGFTGFGTLQNKLRVDKTSDKTFENKLRLTLALPGALCDY